MNLRFGSILLVGALAGMVLAQRHAPANIRRSSSYSNLPMGFENSGKATKRPKYSVSPFNLSLKGRSQSPSEFIRRVETGTVAQSLEFKRTKSVRIHSVIDKHTYIDDLNPGSTKNPSTSFVDTATGPNRSDQHSNDVPHDIWWSSGTFDGWFNNVVYSTKNRNAIERKLSSENALRRNSEAQNFNLPSNTSFGSPDIIKQLTQGPQISAATKNKRDIYGFGQLNPFLASKKGAKGNGLNTYRNGFLQATSPLGKGH